MLTRVHHDRFEFSRPAAQILDHEGELDGVGPRAQDCDDPASFWQCVHSPKRRRTRRANVNHFNHLLPEKPFAQT
jgi:hypothetical protein